MEFRFFLLYLLIISTQTLLKCVESLQCYDCMYYEGLSDNDMGVSPQQRAELFDDSCKSLPKSKFLQKCDDDAVCHNNVIEGYLESDKKNKVKIFERGCIGANTFKSRKDDCEHFKSFDDLHKNEQGPRQPLLFEHKLSSKTAITRCTCKKDGCNTGTGGTGNSSHGPTTGSWFVFTIASFIIKLV